MAPLEWTNDATESTESDNKNGESGDNKETNWLSKTAQETNKNQNQNLDWIKSNFSDNKSNDADSSIGNTHMSERNNNDGEGTTMTTFTERDTK